MDWKLTMNIQRAFFIFSTSIVGVAAFVFANPQPSAAEDKTMLKASSLDCIVKWARKVTPGTSNLKALSKECPNAVVKQPVANLTNPKGGPGNGDNQIVFESKMLALQDKDKGLPGTGQNEMKGVTFVVVSKGLPGMAGNQSRHIVTEIANKYGKQLEGIVVPEGQVTYFQNELAKNPAFNADMGALKLISPFKVMPMVK